MKKVFYFQANSSAKVVKITLLCRSTYQTSWQKGKEKLAEFLPGVFKRKLLGRV
jgi:hypothetical protein